MISSYMLSFAPILEVSGDLMLGDLEMFAEQESAINVFSSPEEAVAAWMGEMSSQSAGLVELPRRRGFGMIYSIRPREGSESVLYAVEVHKCPAFSSRYAEPLEPAARLNTRFAETDKNCLVA